MDCNNGTMSTNCYDTFLLDSSSPPQLPAPATPAQDPIVTQQPPSDELFDLANFEDGYFHNVKGQNEQPQSIFMDQTNLDQARQMNVSTSDLLPELNTSESNPSESNTYEVGGSMAENYTGINGARSGLQEPMGENPFDPMGIDDVLKSHDLEQASILARLSAVEASVDHLNTQMKELLQWKVMQDQRTVKLNDLTELILAVLQRYGTSREETELISKIASSHSFRIPQ
ncbi:hypothetical protein FDECE_13903 [Fusarium decemcellulare]|nr:hypothetical protein FDECE_13903 [Fusarium decemcellulare]